jgi:hypothetical protein
MKPINLFLDHRFILRTCEVSFLFEVENSHPLMQLVVFAPIAEILTALRFFKIVFFGGLPACEKVGILVKSHRSLGTIYYYFSY